MDRAPAERRRRPHRRVVDGRRDASTLRVRGDRMGAAGARRADRDRPQPSHPRARAARDRARRAPARRRSTPSTAGCRVGRRSTIIVIASIASVVGLLALGSVQLSQEIDVVGDAVTERIEAVDPDSAIGRSSSTDGSPSASRSTSTNCPPRSSSAAPTRRTARASASRRCSSSSDVVRTRQRSEAGTARPRR